MNRFLVAVLPAVLLPAVLLAIVLLLSAASPARAEIHEDPEFIQPLLPGMNAPSLTLTGLDGEPVAYDPADHGKPVVLTFYRGGWCPYCNLHLAELRTAEAELQAMGFDVWFLSPDRPALLAEGEDTGFDYRLLSDAGMSAAEAFGIAFRLDEDTLERYRGAGIDLADRSGEAHGALPAPATFLIGADGVIQFAFVNPDYTVRLAPEVLLAAARAYRDDAHARLRRARNR
ncbi:peroxiredoxin-like family protein [Halomonas denitrificans]|nr:AhpC/TSA family protein [Halomonas denitrificans]